MKTLQRYAPFFLLAVIAVLFVHFTKIHRIPKRIAQKFRDSQFTTHQNDSLLVPCPVTEKKPFVLVITSYNNEKYCEKNLHSVFEQNYDNYRVIYIDDCSTDNTYNKVRDLIQREGQEHRVTLIRNKKRMSKFPNIYNAYHSCEDHEIIACLDGDDYLPNQFVLEKLNKYYQNPNVWLTYGTAMIDPQYTRGAFAPFCDKTLKKGTMRDEKKFQMSMLRTFYAGLFKQIKLKDFFYHGKFMPTADDPAFMYPMVEMAPTHTVCIPEITYIINDTNPIREQNTMGKLQREMLDFIYKKEKYKPLDDSFNICCTKSRNVSEPIDLVVFSDDNPLFLAATLESCQKYLTPLETTTVLYRASNEEYREAYKELSSTFQHVQFVQDNDLSFEHLMKQLTTQQRGTSSYLALASDEFLFEKPVNLINSIERMERTGALNCFLDYGTDTMPTGEVLGEFIASDITNLIKIPELRQDSFFGLFRKEDVKATLANKEFKTKGFLEILLRLTQNSENISLVHNNKKTKFLATTETKFAFNKVSRLKKFLQGHRIDMQAVCLHPEGGVKESDCVKA